MPIIQFYTVVSEKAYVMVYNRCVIYRGLLLVTNAVSVL